MNTTDLADDLDILARKLMRGVSDGDLAVDALSIESMLRFAADLLRSGQLDTPRLIGQRIATDALDAAVRELRK